MVISLIKIAICDDEPLVTKDLSNLIINYASEHNLQIEFHTYSNGEQFLADIKKQDKQFDIVFLDIKMKKIDGIETAKIIRKTNEIMIIIFVSSLEEYVFDAFDVEAKGFIVKPIEKLKIYEILNKSLLKLEQNNKYSLALYFNGELQKIPFHQIYYCEVANPSVFVYERAKINRYQGKIDDLEKELNKDFFRCHRSYIVNLNFVDGYKDNMIYMPSGEKIPVSSRRQKEFIKTLLYFQRKEVR